MLMRGVIEVGVVWVIEVGVVGVGLVGVMVMIGTALSHWIIPRKEVGLSQYPHKG